MSSQYHHAAAMVSSRFESGRLPLPVTVVKPRLGIQPREYGTDSQVGLPSHYFGTTPTLQIVHVEQAMKSFQTLLKFGKSR